MDAAIGLRIDGDVAVSLSEDGSAAISLGSEFIGDPLPEYGGSYSVTPSAQEQTLSTANTRLLSDITVAAIPSNYGRISWSGGVLTVS